MEAALRALILADAGVSSAIGDRLFWQRLPETTVTMPAATYELIAQRDEMTHAGPRDTPEAYVQITTWADGKAAATAAAGAIRAAVNGYRGEQDGQEFGLIALENEMDHWDPDSNRAAYICDYRIYFVR